MCIRDRYNNPDDRHILVQDRFNSMNYSFNYGRPAVKVILGVLAAVVAGIVIWVVSLLVSLENVQVTFQEEGGGYRFEAAGYECEFSGDDIQSVKLIDGLPDGRFTRTNGGSTEKVNVGHFRGRETGKCMMFLYNDCTPILEIRLDDMKMCIRDSSWTSFFDGIRRKVPALLSGRPGREAGCRDTCKWNRRGIL